MGYRSDIAILIYGPEYAMTSLLAAERLMGSAGVLDSESYLFKEYGELYNYEERSSVNGFPANEYEEVDVREPWVMLSMRAESVKWYDDYPEIAAWEKFVAICSKTDNILYEFLRVGEEYNDVDYRTSDDAEGYLSTITRIYADLPQRVEAKAGD